jgi:hypothetical protein
MKTIETIMKAILTLAFVALLAGWLTYKVIEAAFSVPVHTTAAPAEVSQPKPKPSAAVATRQPLDKWCEHGDLCHKQLCSMELHGPYHGVEVDPSDYAEDDRAPVTADGCLLRMPEAEWNSLTEEQKDILTKRLAPTVIAAMDELYADPENENISAGMLAEVEKEREAGTLVVPMEEALAGMRDWGAEHAVQSWHPRANLPDDAFGCDWSVLPYKLPDGSIVVCKFTRKEE